MGQSRAQSRHKSALDKNNGGVVCRWLKKEADEMQRVHALVDCPFGIGWGDAKLCILQMAHLSPLLNSKVLERGNCVFVYILSVSHPHGLVNTTGS